MRRRTYRLAAAAVALVGALAVWTVATRVFPYHSLNHDEAVYLQQAAMLLEGQLTLRPPLEEVFRPWFFVEDGDRLYPKYTPVPAAMFAAGRLVGGVRLALAGIAAASLALVVAVVDEVFDRPTGLVAGGFVLASPLFLIDSSVFLPYAPTTLLNLLFAYGYLRADRTDDRRWAAVSGAAVGVAFFARPYTAVLFAVPFVCHALWSLYTDPRAALGRQAVVATVGLAGVGVALGYNALVTGSPWLFPYQAFAPQDGLGFGHREILAHEIRYTPELAVRANGRLVVLFFTEWIAGGILGAALALVGVARAVHRRPSAREAVIAGLFVSVVAGNVYFWGNVNILGSVDRAGDGLVSALGPYYHFDLLLPTAAFAAAGVCWSSRLLYRTVDGRLDRRLARTAFVVVLVAGAGVAGAVTADNLDERIDENMQATNTYEDVYEPFEGGPPKRSLVLLPDPYGDWLNHPFQPLRNDPGFDGRAVYAVGDRPFETVEEFPDRRAYRYVYRGGWAPYAGSPEDARLQRVREVSGSRVRLDTTVGVPGRAVGVTARIATDEGSAYYVASNASDSLDLTLTVADGEVSAAGEFDPVDDRTVAVDGRATVRVTVFVDYGPGGGFAYRFELPLAVSDRRIRALTPRIERCRNARACGGAAAYVPASAPDGVFVRSELLADEPKS
ncbi:MAG: ArnT family glycosyltransferase [Haloferacaceae archaeon]